jgi:tRNA-dihydrouridine synthase C
VVDPGLGLAIKASAHATTGHEFTEALSWPFLIPHLLDFWQIVCTRLDTRSQAGRLKQWLNFLRRRFPEAEVAYQALKTTKDPVLINAWFATLNQQQDQRASLQTSLLAAHA